MGKTKRDNPLKPSRSGLKARNNLWKCVSCSIHFLRNPTFSLNWTEIDVTVWSWRVSEQRITYMHQGKEENIKLKLWAGNIMMEAHSRSRNQLITCIYTLPKIWLLSKIRSSKISKAVIMTVWWSRAVMWEDPIRCWGSSSKFNSGSQYLFT